MSTKATGLKVILATAAIAALASPVMAQSVSSRHAAPWAGAVSNAHGSVARAPRGAAVIEGNQIHLDDAVHVAFPQQSNGM
jgi:hypothetical protein